MILSILLINTPLLFISDTTASSNDLGNVTTNTTTSTTTNTITDTTTDTITSTITDTTTSTITDTITSTTSNNSSTATIVTFKNSLNPAIITPNSSETELPRSKTDTNEFILEIKRGFVDFFDDLISFNIASIIEEYLSENNSTEEYSRTVLMEIIAIDIFNSTKSHTSNCWPWSKFTRIKVSGFKYLNLNDVGRIRLRLRNPKSIFEDTVILNLSGFSLGFIPRKELSLFRNVTCLYLDNILVATGYERLKTMNKLRFVSIKYNNISVFPDFSEFPELVSIDASFNNFGHLDFILNLATNFTIGEPKQSKVTNLILCNSKITKISNIFEAFPSLTTLCIQGNYVANTPDSWMFDAVIRSTCIMFDNNKTCINPHSIHEKESKIKLLCTN